MRIGPIHLRSGFPEYFFCTSEMASSGVHGAGKRGCEKQKMNGLRKKLIKNKHAMQLLHWLDTTDLKDEKN